MTTDDFTLLHQTREGNDRAARELWAKFGPRLVALAHALLRGSGGEAAALDTVQSVFLHLLEVDAAQLRGIRDVGAFLAASTRHAALNHLRSTGRAARRDATPRPSNTSSTAVPGRVPSPDSDPVLRAAIHDLPDELAETVLLRHAAGLTFDQISLSLDQPRGTIAARYRRAIELLQQRLGTTATASTPVALASRGGAP
jgi:RNA polymerase sigma factor (sigma-70 family)